MFKKGSTENFIKRSKEIHGEQFDYSSVEYKSTHKKVKIICKEHGEFKQTPNSHLRGYNGCPKCGIKTTEKFIDEAKKIHGTKYDYSFVDYINNYTNVKILCPTHGIFEQTPNSHLSKKQGCSKCYGNRRLNFNEFVEKSKKIHGDKYDYTNVKYKNNRSEVKILCPIHGKFDQIADSHMRGRGCPICSESKGERVIRNFLIQNNIKFIYQKTFKKCKFINKLIFDFYLKDQNICIEFNGIQHYQPVEWFGGIKSFEYQKNNDEIKKLYCREHNIELIIIKYDDDDIIEKLTNSLIF